MSNNRMYLVCKTDKQVFCIGRYNISSSWKLPKKDFLPEYEKFLEFHTHAYDSKGYDFELVYENDPVVSKQYDNGYQEITYFRRVNVAHGKKDD